MSFINKYDSIDRHDYSLWRARKLISDADFTKSEVNNLILTAHLTGEKLENSLDEVDQVAAGYFYGLRDKLREYSLDGSKVNFEKVDEFRRALNKEAQGEFNDLVIQKFYDLGSSVGEFLASAFNTSKNLVRNALNGHHRVSRPEYEVQTRGNLKQKIAHTISYESQNMLMEAMGLSKDLEELRKATPQDMQPFFDSLENYIPKDGSELEHRVSIMCRDFSQGIRPYNEVKTSLYDKKAHIQGNIDKFIEQFYTGGRGYLFAQETHQILVDVLKNRYPQQDSNMINLERCCGKISNILENERNIELGSESHGKLIEFYGQMQNFQNKLIDDMDPDYAKKINHVIVEADKELMDRFKRVVTRELEKVGKNAGVTVRR